MGKFTFRLNDYSFEIEDLGSEMNDQFIKLHRKYYVGDNFSEEDFSKAALKYFSKNNQNHFAQDNFFNNLTIIAFKKINHDFFESVKLWTFALSIAYEWEKLNKPNKIHKGSPYHFLGITYIIYGDLMNGFLFIHQAVEEDKRTKNSEIPFTPGHHFVTLNYDKSVFGKQLLKEAANYLETKIILYNSERAGLLTLNDFKEKFLERIDQLDIVFSFVYLIFALMKLERNKFENNSFAPLIQVNLILDLCLILDSVLKNLDGKSKFNEHFDYLCKRGCVSIKSDKIGIEVNKRFKCKFHQTFSEILDGKFTFTDKTKPTNVESDYFITYGFRNYGAHNLESQKIINDRFTEIVQRILNSLFTLVEKNITQGEHYVIITENINNDFGSSDYDPNKFNRSRN